MSNHYEEFLKRLVQYRLQVNMTQEKIGQVLGITQSQLSKQELGKTIMTFHSLCILMDIGWDVDFLLQESVQDVNHQRYRLSWKE